jgi:tRNA(fMet)-specific endonuclease VapC
MNGNKAILDTNAVGLYLDDKDFSKNYLKNYDVIEMSVISQIEYLSNPNLSPKNKFLFEEFINFIQIHSISKENKMLVSQTISIRKKYKLKLPDALIAATAIVNNATLFSADKVFSKIFNLKFQHIKI